MSANTPPPAMSRKIFDMGLSVETVSIYLLCCGLVDNESPVTKSGLKSIWNGSGEELEKGLDCLLGKNILRAIISDGNVETVYRIVDAEKWEA